MLYSAFYSETKSTDNLKIVWDSIVTDNIPTYIGDAHFTNKTLKFGYLFLGCFSKSPFADIL